MRSSRGSGAGTLLAVVAVSVVLGASLSAANHGSRAAIDTALLLGASGLPVVLLCRFVLARRGRLGLLGRQFGLGVGLAAALAHLGPWLIVAGVVAPEPLEPALALLLAVGVALTAYSAWMLAVGVRADVMRVSGALMAVGEGRTRVEIRTVAEDETADLARAAERMARQLADREAERDAAQDMRHGLVRAMVEQLTEREAERDAAEARRRELVVALAHDVRTPLTALQLLASAVHDNVVDADARLDYAREMLSQLAALRQLTDEMFELSRLEAGDVNWSLEQVDLGEAIQETADALHPLSQEHGVTIRVELPRGLPAVRAAHSKLLRVLVNVMQNAIQYSRADGVVRVSARERSGEVEVRVGDAGPGVPAAERERVFEPFFRGAADASRTRAGAGLGLAISRAIVEAHGGRIWIEDAGSGACVKFTVPRAAGSALRPRRARRS